MGRAGADARRGYTRAMSRPYTVTAIVVRFLAGAAAAARVDIGDILAAHGVDATRLAETDGRVPHQLGVALWEELPHRAGDEAFGLRLAQRLPRGAYGVLDYAMSNATTLGDSYRIFMRYQRLIHDATPFELIIEGSLARLVHVWRGPGKLPRHLNEFLIASLLVRGRMYLHEDWAPLAVSLPHGRPASAREHQRLFRVPVQFGQPISELTLDRHLLDRRLPAADAGLMDVLDRYVQVLMGQVPAREDFIGQVQRSLLKSLSSGVPEAAVTARGLGMSKRSFFRLLQQHGTSYQQVVEQLRRDLAMRHLVEGQLALAEIAFMLGYSEVSAFHRAFRRWTGQSPAEYRRQSA
jgi:AraC-like DNA-binding protein